MGLMASIEWLIYLHAFFTDASLLGETLSLGERDGVDFELRLPEAKEPPGSTPVQIQQATLVARVESVLGVMPKATEQPAGDGWLDEARRLHRLALEAGDAVLNDFVDLVAYRQNFPELTLLRGPQLAEGRLFVGQSPVEVHYGNRDMRIRLLVPQGIKTEELDEMGRDLRRGARAPLAWQHFGNAYRELQLRGDVRHALITATTAVEVGIKEALRNRRPGDPLMDFMIRRGRLEDLLKDGAKAAFGDTYAAADKLNYEKVLSLQDQRNAIVHKGEARPAAPEVVEEELRAVYALLKWLESRRE